MERVNKHKKFFELLPLLNAQVASLCLRWAGVPRVNNLLATFRHAITKPACGIFDQMEDAFFGITRFSKGQWSEFNQLRMRLPIKDGGDGLRTMVDVAAAAHFGVPRLAYGSISEEMVRRRYKDSGGGRERNREIACLMMNRTSKRLVRKEKEKNRLYPHAEVDSVEGSRIHPSRDSG